MDIDTIKRLCADNTIYWSTHIAKRLIKWGVNRNDVKYAIGNGVIIEDYPDDYPHPSCLISGNDENGNRIHVVCASDGHYIWMVTVYKPDVSRWNGDSRV